MSIQLAVTGLTYFMILVLTYGITVFLSLDEEIGEEIIRRSFNYAYTILVFGLLVVYGLLVLPPVTLDHETASYLILASKCLSVFTLGGSLFILNRKKLGP